MYVLPIISQDPLVASYIDAVVLVLQFYCALLVSNTTCNTFRAAKMEATYKYVGYGFLSMYVKEITVALVLI